MVRIVSRPRRAAAPVAGVNSVFPSSCVHGVCAACSSGVPFFVCVCSPGFPPVLRPAPHAGGPAPNVVTVSPTPGPAVKPPPSNFSSPGRRPRAAKKGAVPRPAPAWGRTPCRRRKPGVPAIPAFIPEARLSTFRLICNSAGPQNSAPVPRQIPDTGAARPEGPRSDPHAGGPAPSVVTASPTLGSAINPPPSNFSFPGRRSRAAKKDTVPRPAPARGRVPCRCRKRGVPAIPACVPEARLSTSRLTYNIAGP